MADALSLEEVAQRRVALGVVDHDVVGGRRRSCFITGIGRSQKPACVILRPASRPGELREVVDRAGVSAETVSDVGERLAAIAESAELRLELALPLLRVGRSRAGRGTSDRALADRVFRAGQAVRDQARPCPGATSGTDR